MLIRRPSIVTINVFYYLPDYTHIIQEFVWSTNDFVPELMRTHAFLSHWHKNIDAVVKEILVGIAGETQRKIESVDHLFRLN